MAARPRPYLAPWVESARAAANFRSAVAVARFAVTSVEVVAAQRDRLLGECIWFVTEADGKYATRYRSRGVLELQDDGPLRSVLSRLRHEHVVTRKSLADRMRVGEDPEVVLADAVACVVTVEEHARLSVYDLTHYGWDRYRAAGVEVIDMATGERHL